jgi:hypothetical protein
MVKYSKRGNYALRTPFASREPAVQSRRHYGPAFPFKRNAIRIPRLIPMSTRVILPNRAQHYVQIVVQ